MKTYKKFNLKWLLSFAVFVLFSCQKEFSKPDAVVKNTAAVANTNVNVYISDGYPGHPIYWKNGSPVYLAAIGGGVQRNTGSIVVLGNYVYVGGTQISHSFTHAVSYWSAI
jgi:hypothetical protein